MAGEPPAREALSHEVAEVRLEKAQEVTRVRLGQRPSHYHQGIAKECRDDLLGISPPLLHQIPPHTLPLVVLELHVPRESQDAQQHNAVAASRGACAACEVRLQQSQHSQELSPQGHHAALTLRLHVALLVDRQLRVFVHWKDGGMPALNAAYANKLENDKHSHDMPEARQRQTLLFHLDAVGLDLWRVLLPERSWHPLLCCQQASGDPCRQRS
mmetsp:Transcript_132350/g.368934  ORF Transcript_132350/g.368934 Transcript_132350/m.368934 type:complete len:214 (+) Transcript_132350:1286-1927(+)